MFHAGVKVRELITKQQRICSKSLQILLYLGNSTNVNVIFEHDFWSMKNEKKCPSCGQWTAWNKQLGDTCSHCGTLLQPLAVKESADRELREKVEVENDFFRIKESDSILMKAVRKSAWVAHVIYAAIVWFFLVTFASTPG